MEKICLDFEAALDFLRGEPKTIEKLGFYSDREEICITSTTLFNLFETVTKRDVVSAFANSITVLPFDRRAAQIAASINKELEEEGYMRGQSESVLTAAVCIANDALLFSRSSEKFDGIRGLKKV